MTAPGLQAAEEVGARSGARGRRRLFAQARFALAVLLTAVGFLLWLRAGFTTPADAIAGGPLPVVLAMLAAMSYSSVGLILALRRPEVRIGALEAWLGVLIAGLTLAWGYLAFAQTPSGVLAPAQSYAALATAVLVTPLVAALAIVLALLFPTDELLSRNWRWVVWLAGIGALEAGVGRLLRPGAVTFVGSYENPVGVNGLGILPEVLQIGGFASLGVAAILAGASLMVRYRKAEDDERAQLRVFAALTVVASVAFSLFVATFVIPAMKDTVREVIVVVNLLIVALGPLTVALAIARYRLYELDQLVGRTFVYGVLTAILAGVYAASLRLFQSVFVALTGESSDAALVITTLILATTFTPIKERLEKVVARWEHSDRRGAAAAKLTSGPPGPFADPAFVARLDEHIRAEVGAAVREELVERREP